MGAMQAMYEAEAPICRTAQPEIKLPGVAELYVPGGARPQECAFSACRMCGCILLSTERSAVQGLLAPACMYRGVLNAVRVSLTPSSGALLFDCRRSTVVATRSPADARLAA